MWKLLLAVSLGCGSAGCKPAADCPQPKFINDSEFPWIDRDFENMYRAQVQCGFKYRNCLKVWKKVSFNSYHAICGDAGE